MNPLHLVARNYRCFDELDLQLPDGCVAILGDNGAGKSSIVNAIDLAIFGPESRSLADVLSDQAVDDELLLDLEVEHAGSVYRIRRTFSPRGRGKTTLDFETYVDGAISLGQSFGWEPLTCSSTKETQERIERTLGLSRETFRASAFLAQGDGAAFTDAQPRDRKRILAQVIGLDRWDRLQELAKRERVGLQEQHLELTGRIRLAEETIAEKQAVTMRRDEVIEVETEVADKVADLEREHAALTERYQAAREQAARRQAAEVQARAARDELARLTATDARATEAADQILFAREHLAKLPPAVDGDALAARERDLLAAVDEYGRLVHVRELAEAAAAAKMRERVELNQRSHTELVRAEQLRTAAEQLRGSDDHATCDRCGQQLEHAARLHAIGNMLEEADTHQRDGERLRDAAAAIEIPPVPPAPVGEPPTVELAEVRASLATARDAQQQRARLEERVVQLQPTVTGRPTPEQLRDARAAVADAEQAVAQLQPVDVDEITRQGTLVKQRLEAARGQLELQRTLKARLDERLARIADAENTWAETMKTRDLLGQQSNVVVQLERAFGRDGIPALIVENSAIPYLETEANRILDELGTPYRVELRTQAELKSGDGLRDTLDVVVTTEQGERAYETFSGGERTRINLALRIALARLLAHRRGAESRLLAIDEPEFLDEPGTAALVDVLRGLQDDFDKLYIVSHVPALRDSFDTTLTVVRDGATSRVEGVDVFEAAAA